MPWVSCTRNARCLNGGRLLIPDSPFGYCQCICLDDYAGPRCQFPRNRRDKRLA
ncbi:hypothetical protein ACJMK2_009530, partial [Sinanodonta woodiana]